MDCLLPLRHLKLGGDGLFRANKGYLLYFRKAMKSFSQVFMDAKHLHGLKKEKGHMEEKSLVAYEVERP